MADPFGLTGEAAIIANQIRTIDRNLDALERQQQESIIWGLHNSAAAMAGIFSRARPTRSTNGSSHSGPTSSPD